MRRRTAAFSRGGAPTRRCARELRRAPRARSKSTRLLVGRRLVALEEALGARLFDRTSDGLQLTAAGERALAHVEQMEESAAALERAVAGEDARLDGVVRLATSETLAATFLVRALGAFHVRQPGIVLEVVTGASSVNLLKREADLAVRMTSRPTQANLIARKLAEMGWALYVARDLAARRPLSESLAAYPLIEEEYRALYRASGFELARVVPAHPSCSVVEGRAV
jgi:DNA-binding transcriptional LysR family regulator